MKALDAMLPANAGERRTLADIIFSKLDNLEAGKPDVAPEKRHGAFYMRAFLNVRADGSQTLTVYPTLPPAWTQRWWKSTQSTS